MRSEWIWYCPKSKPFNIFQDSPLLKLNATEFKRVFDIHKDRIAADLAYILFVKERRDNQPNPFFLGLICQKKKPQGGELTECEEQFRDFLQEQRKSIEDCFADLIQLFPLLG